MSTKQFPALVAFTLVMLLGVAADSGAQVRTIKVDATKKSVDTGVKLDVGDRVEVTAVSGQVYMNRPPKPENATTFEGWTQFKPGEHTCVFANATPSSLVGYIGDPKSYYQVRKSIYVEAKAAGNLFFAVNDQPLSYGDNSGEFVVSYKIIKKELIRSRDLGGKLRFAWVNKTDGPITVNWIDQAGKEEKAKLTIAPSKVFDGDTYVGHIFRVRDTKGAEIGLIEVEATSEKVDIKK